MLNTNDDNLDDIDLDELFNDFDEKQSSISRQLLTQYDRNKKNQDDLIELNENDCTAPRINRKQIKKKKIFKKQMTMYDYASSISYKHKQFYSSLDNTTTIKIITKGQKRSLTDCQQQSSSSSSSPISKKSKTIDYDNSSPSPDFIDNLLRYLDERSHHTIENEKQRKEKELQKNKSSIL